MEITEDVFISDFQLIREKIRNLHAQGFQISLDDFGSGYSSLRYLNDLEIDEIKIDKSIVKKIKDSTKSQVLIRSIASFAQEIHILTQMDCLRIQGFLFSKPAPPESYGK